MGDGECRTWPKHPQIAACVIESNSVAVLGIHVTWILSAMTDSGMHDISTGYGRMTWMLSAIADSCMHDLSTGNDLCFFCPHSHWCKMVPNRHHQWMQFGI